MAHLYFSDTSPLLNKTGSEHMFETMEMEIEQLLSKVGLVIFIELAGEKGACVNT